MSPIHPSLLQRKIIHFDMDAFYASVEERDDPSLKGKPVVVGGLPQSRAVVCTANYVARQYGVHSAMACSRAARLCPDAIFLRPDFKKYSAASQKIREIFRQHTTLIEPLSLDEAYLDVTQNAKGLYATQIAKLIQQEIYETLGLTGSAGVAPNKLIAKIASDYKKPNGITVVVPEQVEAFMRDLPLRKIHGIGPKTEQRLTKLGFKLCRDIWPYTLEDLQQQLGDNMGAWLFERARGLDDRPVQTTRERKSLGQEETFNSDILDLDILQQELIKLVQGVSEDLQHRSLKGRTITLKVKYDDFSLITRSQSLLNPTSAEAIILENAQQLLHHRTEAGKRKIRLLGVSLSNLT